MHETTCWGLVWFFTFHQAQTGILHFVPSQPVVPSALRNLLKNTCRGSKDRKRVFLQSFELSVLSGTHEMTHINSLTHSFQPRPYDKWRSGFKLQPSSCGSHTHTHTHCSVSGSMKVSLCSWSNSDWSDVKHCGWNGSSCLWHEGEKLKTVSCFILMADRSVTASSEPCDFSSCLCDSCTTAAQPKAETEVLMLLTMRQVLVLMGNVWWVTRRAEPTTVCYLLSVWTIFLAEMHFVAVCIVNWIFGFF